MDNFPIANSFFRKSYIRNDKIRALLPPFEEALYLNQKVRNELKEIQPELKALEYHSALCHEVLNVSVASQNTEILASKCVAICYDKILHMEQLIKDVELGDILKYTVKCKEDETLREISLIRKSFNEEAKQLDVLEARSVVNTLRQLLMHQEMSQKCLDVLKREVYKMELQMLSKIRDSTDYRNKKIIAILENKKLIDSFEAPGFAGTQTRINSNSGKRPSIPPKSSSNDLFLQPALDFINKFMNFKVSDGNKHGQEKDMDEFESEQEMPLQSILHRNKRVPSPTKQVRFVPSPDLESVHIVNRLSSLSSDDGSMEKADSEPDSGNGSKKSSQMEGLIDEMEECEDWKDARSENNELEDQYGQLTQMEADEKESSGKMKESTQAKELSQNQSGAFLDEVDVKGNVKKSKKKIEVLNVMISKFNLTANQKSSSDVIDVLEDNGDKYQMTEDEDEDENTIEFPMAQPNPAQFKPPAPMAVSPPSSDQADSMLNFSEPNCEFDDFWQSNTETINTIYDL